MKFSLPVGLTPAAIQSLHDDGQLSGFFFTTDRATYYWNLDGESNLIYYVPDPPSDELLLSADGLFLYWGSREKDVLYIKRLSLEALQVDVLVE